MQVERTRTNGRVTVVGLDWWPADVMEENGPPPTDEATVDWAAGFGDVTTEVVAGETGPMWFMATQDRRTVIFEGRGELAWALFLTGERVVRDMPSEQALEWLLARGAVGDYVVQALRNPSGHGCPRRRFQHCVDVAGRLMTLTYRPETYSGRPEWQPAWRQNRLAHRKVVPA